VQPQESIEVERKPKQSACHVQNSVVDQPVAGMDTNRPPDYPETSRRNGEQGRVLLQVAVSPAGLPVNVCIAESSGFPALDSAAVDAVRQWHFVPATRTGAPVAATTGVPLRFNLTN
jgi:protein TonB